MRESLATNRDLVRTTKTDESWQNSMKRAIRSASELCRRLNLPEDVLAAALAGEASNPFPVFVPLEFLRRMEPANPADPLLRQVMPLADEAADVAGFGPDPVGELGVGAGSHGLLRKYHGRALLIAHQACGVHCRYCFRRHFPYQTVAPGSQSWDAAITELATDTSIDEVILSGGDPLVLTDPALAMLVERVARVPHVRRLRIHSRMPIVIPNRVTERLVRILTETRLACWMVVHANHPAELDGTTIAALQRFLDAGIPVLNQAVLLRGVNDDPQVMESLCRRLIDALIQPYYLHQLDRVAGAAHFEVDVQRGREIIDHLRRRLPGYAVPQYVREQAGEPSKTPIG